MGLIYLVETPYQFTIRVGCIISKAYDILYITSEWINLILGILEIRLR
jgi:hypothetical protein